MTITVITRNSVYEIDPVTRTWSRAWAGQRTGKIRMATGTIAKIWELRVGRPLLIETNELHGKDRMSRFLVAQHVIDIYVDSEDEVDSPTFS